MLGRNHDRAQRFLQQQQAQQAIDQLVCARVLYLSFQTALFRRMNRSELRGQPAPCFASATFPHRRPLLPDRRWPHGTFQIECALKNEGHPGSHWNVGVLLKQVNDIENALSWMKAASDLHPTYVKYVRRRPIHRQRTRTWRADAPPLCTPC